MRYKAVEGGTQEVEAQPSELRFFDKQKGVTCVLAFETSHLCLHEILLVNAPCMCVFTLFWEKHSRQNWAILAQPSLSCVAACEN